MSALWGKTKQNNAKNFLNVGFLKLGATIQSVIKPQRVKKLVVLAKMALARNCVYVCVFEQSHVHVGENRHVFFPCRVK